jgi:hypothetical protein
MIVGLGNIFFVRKLKLIWQNQKINLKKQPQTIKNQLSSTISFLCILFDNLGCAIKLHAKFVDGVTKLHSLDPRNYLFNGQEGGDNCNYFLFWAGYYQ